MQVGGFSLRLLSSICWLFGLSCVLAICTHAARWAAPAIGLAYPLATSPFLCYVLYSLILFCNALPPLLMEWWFRMVPKSNSTFLLSKWAKRLPGWQFALWLGSPGRAVKAALLCCTLAACGTNCVQNVVASFGGPANMWFIGVPAGLAHACVFFKSSTVVEYPILHRGRLLRLKDKLPSAIGWAMTSWFWSAVAALLLPFLPYSVPFPYLCAALFGSALCCLLWALSTTLVGIVLSERLFLQHYEDSGQVLRMLVERLATVKAPLDEALTLQEMSVRGRFYGMQFWGDLFQEHMGTQLWHPISVHCLSQLDELCRMLGIFMAAQRGAAKDGKPVEWNSRRVPAKPLRGASQEQLFVEDWLRRRAQACRWCAMTVADVATLSRAHDTFGLLQMPPPGTPGFADVVRVLLQSFALLDQFLLFSTAPRRGTLLPWWLDPSAVARRLGLVDRDRLRSRAGSHAGLESLHDCVLQCLHQIAGEFGTAMPGALSRSKWAAPIIENMPDLAVLATALCGG